MSAAATHHREDNGATFQSWIDALNLPEWKKFYDILPGEKPQDFYKFVFFRNLGPTRSMPDAADAYFASRDVAEVNGKRYPKTHQFYKVARRWYWRERAALYDADMLGQCGPELLLAMNMLVKKITHKVLAGINNIECKTMDDLCKLLDRLPSFVPRGEDGKPLYDQHTNTENPILLSGDPCFDAPESTDDPDPEQRRDCSGEDSEADSPSVLPRLSPLD